MLFNSAQFLIFFPIVVILYFVLPQRVRMYWLLVTSYYFYMCWNAKYALLILTSTGVTYSCGLLIDRFSSSSKRKCQWVMAGSILINVGILAVFKYFNAFLNLDLLLPVGISFYTFQALGYTVDVYRGDIRAERNFFKYALFVSFFPQLVAGPIERSGNLLKQLDCTNSWDYEKARDGFLLMLWGYFLKIVLADRIAMFVDTVYGDVSTYSGLYVVIATILFGIQIYCDFAGYTVIAMGAAQILGIKLMDNFASPYLATSVSDFWRRWHISLTSWFKDYLYIPLGGSRCSTLRKYMNKLIVFLVSGLWHGASLSFVVWGGLNGVYQIIGEALSPLRKRECRIVRTLVTFVLVDFAWLFFRAGTMSKSVLAIKSMFTGSYGGILSTGQIYECGLGKRAFIVVIICILVLAIVDICKDHGICIRQWICRQNVFLRCLIIVFSVCVILTFGVWGSGYDATGFIYFQF